MKSFAKIFCDSISITNFRIVLILFLLSGIMFCAKAQIFSQNFDSSSNLNDYFNSTPSANQFRSIGTTGSTTIGISSNSLVINSAGGAFWAERNVDFNTIPTAVKFQFDVSLAGTANTSPILVVLIGSDVKDSASSYLANYFSRWGISVTGTSGEFKVWYGGINGPSTFNGLQTVTTFCNRSGVSMNYLAPDSSTESLANNKIDIWVGNKKEFNDVSASNSTFALARFKFATGNFTIGENITIDNIVISELTPLTAIEDNNTTIPKNYFLGQNYPNPFNPSTVIRYAIPKLSNVKITVYNMLGQAVQNLFEGEKAPGNYEVNFDASRLSSGVYFYRIEAGNFSQTKKMLLMK